MNNKVTYCLFMLLIVTNIYAEIADPTKPPKKIAARITVETEPLKLKMIRLDNKNGKHTANINGEIVKLGGIYADAKVVNITEEYVELKGPKGEKILLKLFKRKHKFMDGSTIDEEIFEDIKDYPKKSY